MDYDNLLNDAFENDDEDTEEDIKVQIPAAIIAGAGLITVMIVIFGCIGACKVRL